MEADEGSDQKSDIQPHCMAGHAHLKNEFMEDVKNHNLMTWLFCSLSFLYVAYRNDPKFSDRQVWANSADPDQMAPRGVVWSGSTLFAIPSSSALTYQSSLCVQSVAKDPSFFHADSEVSDQIRPGWSEYSLGA